MMGNSLIIFTMLVIVFAGCGNSNDMAGKAQTWKEHEQIICSEQLKKILRDPNSYESVSWDAIKLDYKYYLEFKNKYPEWDGKQYKWVLVNSYRAKNGFGGYNFGEAYFMIDSVENVEYVEKGFLPTYINNQIFK